MDTTHGPHIVLAPISHWVQDTIDPNRLLTTIIFPGTHGSSAYRISNNQGDDRDRQVKYLVRKLHLRGILRRWSLNQTSSIYQQLCLGARSIHLEVTYMPATNL